MFSSRRSRPINQGNPKVLKARDLPSVVQYIESSACENVMLMLGAGVSTSAGIPDFRSPETGLYSNLQRLNLPHPEAVFEINFFRRNPVPFYTLAHELYPGKFRPTITHSFIRLLAEKKLLHTCFTQNIDTLERRAGVPDEKIIEAHGSFATQRCIDCQRPYDDAKMKDHIKRKAIAKCDSCQGFIKPDIVFFGEGLPSAFARAVPNLRKADLLIVIGTSLTVHPFASLTGMVDESCPRVLINMERVGDFGSRTDDVILLGKCDEIVLELCQSLDWEKDLNRLWELTKASVVTEPEEEVEESKSEELPEPKSAHPRDNLEILAAVEARLAKMSVKEGKEEGKDLEPSTDTVPSNTTASANSTTKEEAEKVAENIVDAIKGAPQGDVLKNDPATMEK
ncbi:DHS-like NAD/FAD-binding domain-containing protein [Crepidotus variabilis]|uniref:NAD-dependent protein deacetylase n=1 Tax=Crepidotus variabilis TaxID=179855 RepID=A0A9P6JKY1_9AGAR|nr:DHS-like NAD/FAD-binding domain-containing protein [Crepidotus variabilis]